MRTSGPEIKYSSYAPNCFRSVTEENVGKLLLLKEGIVIHPSLLKRDFYERDLGKHSISLKYGVGSKVVERSYRLLKSLDPKKFNVKVRNKYSTSQFRRDPETRKRPPCIIVSPEELERAFSAGLRREEIRAKFGLTDFILDRNLVYHGLRDTFEDSRKLIPLRSLIENQELLQQLGCLVPGFFESVRDFNDDPKDNLPKIFEAHLRINYIADYIQSLGRKLTQRSPNRAFSFTRNRGELAVANILFSLSVSFFQQKKIGSFVYDFFIPSKKLLLEVDGSSHFKGENILKHKDEIKTLNAKKKGYKFLRLVFSDKGILHGEEKLKKELS